MSNAFSLCKLLIQKGRTDGLIDKMDVFLAADRLTTEEYTELINASNYNLKEQHNATECY